MNSGIIHIETYNTMKVVNIQYIFPQIFISIFKGLFNDKIDLRVCNLFWHVVAKKWPFLVSTAEMFF